jgi:hypothetical protein
MTGHISSDEGMWIRIILTRPLLPGFAHLVDRLFPRIKT